jgi:hypothetical protein
MLISMHMPLLQLLLIVAGLMVLVALLRAVFGLGERAAPGDDLGTERVCPRCHELNPTHARFCAHCGIRLG